MPVKSSPYYNDPALAQAFSNLSGLFNAPDGKDAYAWAEANAAKQKAARLADLYSYASGATPDRGVLDTRAAAAGVYTPNQSFYSVDQDNATKRYGDDLTAQTSITNNQADNEAKRYGFDQGLVGTRYTADQNLVGKKYGDDLTAQTSIANNQADNTRALTTNTADNTRALQTNTADNTRALQQSALQQQGDTIRNQFGALNAGQTRPGMPEEIARAIGLPAIAPQQGIVTLDPGQTATLPSGQMLAGTPKPMSTDETVASNIPRLLKGGQLQDSGLLDIIMGKDAPVTTLGGPNGQTPVYMSPGAAARTNAPAFVKPEAGARPDVMNYALGDRHGTAVAGPDGVLRDTQTGEKLPPGVTTFKGQAQGQPGDFSGKPTEASDKSAAFAVRGAAANETLNGMLQSGYVPNIRDYEMTQGVGANSLPTSISNSLTSSDGQKFGAASIDFLNSVLRPDTGASFSKAELDSYARTFLPIPGDSPEAAAAKQRARALVVGVMQENSRGGADRIATGLQQLGLPVPPTLLTHLRTGQGGAPAAAAPAGQSPAPQAGFVPQEGQRLRGPDGKIYVVKNGQPVPEQ